MRKRDILEAPVAFGWIGGLLAANLVSGSRPSSEKRERKKRRQRSDSPKPLPSRRRALTLPLEQPLDSKRSPRQQQQQQQQSLFLNKLPPDVRYLIYQHVLRGSNDAYVHVASTHQRVCSFPCSELHDELHGHQHVCWWDAAVDGTTMPRAKINGPRQDVVSGLLCCCKQVYVIHISPPPPSPESKKKKS